MTFIPNELQEDKRKAETALAVIMLSHPDQAKAISLYFGKVESALWQAAEWGVFETYSLSVAQIEYLKLSAQQDGVDFPSATLVNMGLVLKTAQYNTWFASPKGERYLEWLEKKG